jgi:hypothetical protein
MKHDFHLVLKSEMKNKILNFSRIKNISLSATVILILKRTKPILQKYHYLNQESKKNGKYSIINADSDIHVYLEEEDYKMMKHIYANMNVYSMAILLRKIIDLFFKGINKFGIKLFFKKLDFVKIKYNERFKKLKKWDKYCNKKQLSHLLSKNLLYKLTFSTDYTLLGFELL